MNIECLREIVNEARALGIRCELTTQGLEVVVRAEYKNSMFSIDKTYDWVFLIHSNCSEKNSIIRDLKDLRIKVNSRLAKEIENATNNG